MNVIRKKCKPEVINPKASSEPFKEQLTPKLTVIIILTAPRITTQKKATVHNSVYHMHNGHLFGRNYSAGANRAMELSF